MAKDVMDDWVSRESINSHDVLQMLGETYLLTTGSIYRRSINDVDDVLEAFARVCAGRNQVVRGVKALQIDEWDMTDKRDMTNRGLLALVELLEAGHFNDVNELALPNFATRDFKVAGQKFCTLLGSNRLSNLRSLTLGGSGFRAQGMETFTQSLRSGLSNKLDVLRLRTCLGDVQLYRREGFLFLDEAGPTALEALTNTIVSGHLSSLRTLDLSENNLWADEARLFLVKSFCSGNFKNLESLYLSGVELGNKGVESLAQAFAKGQLENLRTLGLARNSVAAQGVDTLANSFPPGHKLESLDLRGNDVRDKGTEHLANAFASGHLSNLRSLDLSDNFIGAKGAESLGLSFLSGRLIALETVKLAGNEIGGIVLVALEEAAKSGGLSALKTVDLANQVVNYEKRVERLSRIQKGEVAGELGKATLISTLIKSQILKGQISVAKDAMEEWASRESINVYDMRQILGEPFLTMEHGRYVNDGNDVLVAFAELCKELTPVVRNVKALKIDDFSITALGLLALVVILEAAHFSDLHELAISSRPTFQLQSSHSPVLLIGIVMPKFCDLLESGRLNHIRSLHLDFPAFGGEGMQAFALSLRTSRSSTLEALRLNFSPEDEGAREVDEVRGVEALLKGMEYEVKRLPKAELSNREDERAQRRKGVERAKDRAAEVNEQKIELEAEVAELEAELAKLDAQLRGKELEAERLQAEWEAKMMKAKWMASLKAGPKKSLVRLRRGAFEEALREVRKMCKGVQAMAVTIASGHLSNLLTLELRFTNSGFVGEKGARFLTKSFFSGQLNKLKSLDLSGNKFGDAGVDCLVEAFSSGYLGNLRMLGLVDNGVGAEGVNSLAKSFESGHLNNLESLELGRNNVGDAGAERLANTFASGHLDNLWRLGLGGNGVGAEGVASLSGHLKKVESLDLGNNILGDAGAANLADAFTLGHLSSLRALDLSNNSIGRSLQLFNRCRSDSLDLLSPTAINSHGKNPYLIISIHQETQGTSTTGWGFGSFTQSTSKGEDFNTGIHSAGFVSWDQKFSTGQILVLCDVITCKEKPRFMFFHVEGMANLFGVGIPYSKVTLVLNKQQVVVEEMPEKSWKMFWLSSYKGAFKPFLFTKAGGEIGETSQTLGNNAFHLRKDEAPSKVGISIDGPEVQQFVNMSEFMPQGAEHTVATWKVMELVKYVFDLVFPIRKLAESDIQFPRETIPEGGDRVDGDRVGESSDRKPVESDIHPPRDTTPEGGDRIGGDKVGESSDTKRRSVESDVQSPSDAIPKVGDEVDESKQRDRLVVDVFFLDLECPFYKSRDNKQVENPSSSLTELGETSSISPTLTVEFFEESAKNCVNTTLDVKYEMKVQKGNSNEGWCQNDLLLYFEYTDNVVPKSMLKDNSVISKVDFLERESMQQSGKSTSTQWEAKAQGNIGGGGVGGVTIGGQHGKTGQSGEINQDTRKSKIPNLADFPRFSIREHCATYPGRLSYRALFDDTTEADGLQTNVRIKVMGEWILLGEGSRGYKFKASKTLSYGQESTTAVPGQCRDAKHSLYPNDKIVGDRTRPRQSKLKSSKSWFKFRKDSSNALDADDTNVGERDLIQESLLQTFDKRFILNHNFSEFLVYENSRRYLWRLSVHGNEKSPVPHILDLPVQGNEECLVPNAPSIQSNESAQGNGESSVSNAPGGSS